MGPVVLTQTRPDSGETVGQEQGVGVVLAQHPAHASQGVLAELATPLIMPQRPQGNGEVAGWAMTTLTPWNRLAGSPSTCGS
jgi:hypothetical protein